MDISIPKTKVLHVRRQEEQAAITAQEAISECKYSCPHISCDFKFRTRRGMLVHAGTCPFKDEWEIDRIVDCKGEVFNRKYKIRWKGFTADHDTWEPRSNVHPDAIKEFEVANNLYDHSWIHRCHICDLACKSRHGVSIHVARVHNPHRVANGEDKIQNFKGTRAEEAAKVAKLTEAQKSRPTVTCEGKPLENVFKFGYLGTIFSADGNQMHDIEARLAQAQVKCGQLRNIFDDENLSLGLKIRLYASAICSILSYGAETWDLNPKVRRRINNINSLMLARITGKSIREEARPCSTSFNLVRNIRQRRLRWLGCILRADQNRLLYQAIVTQYEMGKKGNLLMDAPPHSSIQHLTTLAQDKALWRRYVKGVPSV